MTGRTLTPLALSTLALSAAAQSVWVVDDTPGVGVDFASIQTAVDAAADGDVLLVRAGTYSAFTIFAKSLVVSAELAAQVKVQGGIGVRGLLPTQSVVLRGLDVVNPHEEGATLKNDAGPVWIEDCTLVGGVGDNSLDGLFAGEPLHSFPAALVEGCDEVVFARCELRGGHGLTLWDEEYQYDAGDDGHGLSLDGGRVSLFACQLVGGEGGDVQDTTTDTGGLGGDAARVASGSLFASGAHFAGGDGGWGDSDLWGCGGGGSGGDGVQLSFGGSPELRHQDCSFDPGTGGIGGPGCSAGPDGLDVRVVAGTAVALSGAARGLSVSSPHREGESATFAFEGVAGDAVVAAVSAAQGHLPLDAFAGTLVLDPAFLVYPMGTVPAGGVLSVPVAIPGAADPATLARRVLVQSAHVDGSPAVWLGHGSALLMLDSSL
jgi:hypothetical protein